MSEFAISLIYALLAIYGAFLFIFWVIVAIDEGEFLLEYFNKNKWYHDKLSKDEWFTVIWISLFWPIIFIYKFIFKWSIPTFKFLYKSVVFILQFIIYPFKKLIELIPKRNTDKEPLKYRIAKWIVKKFKL